MTKKTHLTRNAFFDGEVGIQRYDVVKYPHIEMWNAIGLAHFWRPEEVDITKDAADFQTLSFAEQHIYLSNLKRQIKLDTVQGREPVHCFGPLASLPEVENAISNLSFQETIHSRSYTHIIRNTLPDPSVVFDSIDDVPEITELGEELNKFYNALDEFNRDTANFGSYEHKKAFWLALISANALEGIRFYVSFACSWAFAQIMNKMEGNAKIIKLIGRDENEHLKLVQYLIEICLAEDPDFVRIKEETKDQVYEIYEVVNRQEKNWARYLFQHGDLLGLDVKTLDQFVDLQTVNIAKEAGYEISIEPPATHPIPWIEDWIVSGRRQNALQETENDSYLIGSTGGTIDINELAAEFLN